MIANTYFVFVSTTAFSNRNRTQLTLAFVAVWRGWRGKKTLPSKKKVGGKRRNGGGAPPNKANKDTPAVS